MIDEPIRWSHAYGKPVVPSSWQMTIIRIYVEVVTNRSGSARSILCVRHGDAVLYDLLSA